MISVEDIQFSGPPCGRHGLYTFYRGFSYNYERQSRPCNGAETEVKPVECDTNPNNVDRSGKSNNVLCRTVLVGDFFHVRVHPEAPVCVGELQLVWESSSGAPDQMLASVKLYYRPDDTPAGRQYNHGQDEVLVIKDKIVLEIVDLVKWILDIDQVPHGWPDATEQRHVSASHAVIVSYPRYCRYRAMMKRLSTIATPCELDKVLVHVLGSLPANVTSVQQRHIRIMFCRSAITHPDVDKHPFRRDGLAPKLKGRRRRIQPRGYEIVNDQRAETRLKKVTANSLNVEKTEAAVTYNGKELLKKGKETFEKQLFKYMKEKKTPIKRRPYLGFKEVDLFNFFSLAHKFGGYDKITEDRLWKHIYDQLGGHPGNTSAATCTRRIYEKLLLAFERHMRGQDDRPLPAPYLRPAKPVKRQRLNPSSAAGGAGENSNSVDDTISMTTETSDSALFVQSPDEMQESPEDLFAAAAADRHQKSSSLKPTDDESSSAEKKSRKRRAEHHFKVKLSKLKDFESQSWSAVPVSGASDCKVILKNCRRLTQNQDPAGCGGGGSQSGAPVSSFLASTDNIDVDEHGEVVDLKKPFLDPAAVSTSQSGDKDKMIENGDVASLKDGTKPVITTGANKPPEIESRCVTNSSETVKPPCVDGLVSSEGVNETKVLAPVSQQHNKPTMSVAGMPLSLVAGAVVSTSACLTSLALCSSSSSMANSSALLSKLVVGNTATVQPQIQQQQPPVVVPMSVASNPLVNGWSYPLINSSTWAALTGGAACRPPLTTALQIPVSNFSQHTAVRIGVPVVPTYPSVSAPVVSSAPVISATSSSNVVDQSLIANCGRVPQVGSSEGGSSQHPVLSASPAVIGFNSPIKQFIDRNRVYPSPVNIIPPILDDEPADLSMKTLRRLEEESRQFPSAPLLSAKSTTFHGSLELAAAAAAVDETPLDLSVKKSVTAVSVQQQNECVNKTVQSQMLAPTPATVAPSSRPMPLTPGPILTVPMCFTTRPTAGQLQSVSVAGPASSNASVVSRLIMPNLSARVPALSTANSAPMMSAPLKPDLSRAPLGVPIMQLPTGPYPSASNFAILHPAFQLSPSPAGIQPASLGHGSLPLSPATPVIATLSPFIGSPFLMTHLAPTQTTVPTASLCDAQITSDVRK